MRPSSEVSASARVGAVASENEAPLNGIAAVVSFLGFSCRCSGGVLRSSSGRMEVGDQEVEGDVVECRNRSECDEGL